MTSESPESVFVGVSGASGAPYALRLVQALAAAGCALQLSVSDSGVLVPRETPLTRIHLRRLLELAEAGAVVLPAMPGFYTRPESLQDAVDHVTGKVMSALGFAQTLFPPWDGGRR